MFTLHYAQTGDGFRGFPGRRSEPEVSEIRISDGVKFAAAGLLIWTGMVLAGNVLPAGVAVFAIIAGAGLLIAALGLPGGSIGDFRDPAVKAANA